MSEAKSIGEIVDLFGNSRFQNSKGKLLSERSALTGYFATETGKDPKVIGIRLAHYSLDQLYGLQSGYKDRLNRNNREQANKWFWWTTRTEYDPT